MTTVVVDTDVLVSAALYPLRPAGRAVEVCRRRYVIAQTADSFSEYRRTLFSAKFDRLLSRRERARAVGAIRRSSQFFRVDPGPRMACDPDDDVFLHLAVVADAVAIVTGDRDLLVLSDFAGIPILSPSRFLRGERSIRRGRRERGE
jgi:putative PIN family toxin of toxin-antitoxin system